jgi:hypothetical protein
VPSLTKVRDRSAVSRSSGVCPPPMLLPIHHMSHSILQCSMAVFFSLSRESAKNDSVGSFQVFRTYRHCAGLRRWIAAAAAFTLTLHVLLSPLTIGKPAPWQVGANGDVFVICHGAGANSDADQDGPIKQPPQDAHCVLCTLAHSCALLPAAAVVVSLEPGTFSRLAVLFQSQVTEHRSPTGEYPRGPPTHVHIAS